MATKLTILLGTVALVLAGCGGKPSSEIQWRAFDGDRAFAHVQRLVGYGPRPSGSHNLIRASTYLATQLQEAGLDTDEQVFMASTPRGPMQFRNVIGKTREQHRADNSVIIIASHYDTKLLPHINFVGANDGGSSVGVALEMARVASAQPNLWFVFFDGEEAMVDYGDNDGLWGSKYFVEELKGQRQTSRIKAVILLDMVGDARLNITIPANGNQALIQHVFDAARDTGNRDSFGLFNAPMLDDHVPFLKAGIPAVDIIDFEFGSAPGKNDYWHTEKDTLDKISPRSMEIVGQTALRLLELLKKTPTLR